MKPPAYLGPYKVGESLGRGGMGTVFRAQHAKSQEDVAIKLIAQHVSDEMKFRRRFASEIETLKRLRHPNIVRLIGYGEEHGQLFYSMELVRGETLQSVIRAEKKLPWMRTLDIAIQICGALKHAHDIGVIHRDLKPANLILEPDDTVKLVDFGISKIFGHDQTAAGAIMGTADYMAPEQAANSGISARTDLYSLGCVIYAMLCGRPPFKGKSITEVIDALKTQEAVALDLIDPDLPEDVVQIVHELLEKQPHQRPPTALAVMNRLKAMRAGLHKLQTMSDEGNRTNSPSKDLDDGTIAGTDNREIGEPTNLKGDRDDTLAMADTPEDVRTSPSQVDLSAKTIGTEGHSKKNATVGTEFSHSEPSSQDTSTGSAGQTHFKTVSEGDVRESFFSPADSETESPWKRNLSIAVLSIALLGGLGLVVSTLLGPNPDELLTKIDATFEEQGATFDLQRQYEQFLKLFPDHPRAEEINDRRLSYRVDSAIRRLKRNRTFRSGEAPLFETEFLAAMEMRDSDPKAASEKLAQWITIFHDSTVDEEDERSSLAELAEFESNRLKNVQPKAVTPPLDPRLQDLLERVASAQSLPAKERRDVLRGIIERYDAPKEAWAKRAVDAARSALNRLDVSTKENNAGTTESTPE
ncbi:MAG: serine/threonine-protein kinase [Planctomycetota bacterium]